MSKHVVLIQGWGDNEDEFYEMGSYPTKAKANAALEEMLVDWEADGSSRTEVVFQVVPAH